MVKMIKLKKDPTTKTETVSFKVDPALAERLRTLTKSSLEAGYKADLEPDFTKWLTRQLNAVESHLKGDGPKAHGKGK